MLRHITLAADLRELPHVTPPPRDERGAASESAHLIPFTDLGLTEPLLRAIAQSGYTEPTPIQARMIPPLLNGEDALGIAQTGTGKTAAFVLPLLQAVCAMPGPAPAKTCRALVLVPTRELAAQVADSVRTYGKHLRHRTAVVVGGVSYVPQKRALGGGSDVVIATPGRLEDHLKAGVVRLDATTTLILDEADQMLDLGFLPAIRRIVAQLPAERQTVLLSATMAPAIKKLADGLLTKPVEITVAAAAKPADRVEQSVHLVDATAKRAKLVDLLNDPAADRSIVFTRTKYGADKVAKHLKAAGLAADAIHGNKSQSQRRRTLDGFKRGRIDVLVATDIAARGIDVDDVSHVINFELPNLPEVYVHRIGRTARAGKRGVAISLCDPSERRYLRDIERLTGHRLLGRDERHAGSDRPTGAKRPAARPKARKPAKGPKSNPRRRAG